MKDSTSLEIFNHSIAERLGSKWGPVIGHGGNSSIFDTVALDWDANWV